MPRASSEAAMSLRSTPTISPLLCAADISYEGNVKIINITAHPMMYMPTIGCHSCCGRRRKRRYRLDTIHTATNQKKKPVMSPNTMSKPLEPDRNNLLQGKNKAPTIAQDVASRVEVFL